MAGCRFKCSTEGNLLLFLKPCSEAVFSGEGGNARNLERDSRLTMSRSSFIPVIFGYFRLCF